MRTAKTRHVISNSGGQWAFAVFFYLCCLLFFMWYHHVRSMPYNLYNLEKCTGIAAIYCLTLSLSLGPLSRFLPKLERFLPCRRTLGIVAVVGSFPHVLLTIFYLPRAVPETFSPDYFMSWFVAHWFTIVAGGLSLIIFVLIALFSYPSGFRRLGKRKWMILQKCAYLVMVLVVLHMLSMGKIPKNWIIWLETRNKLFPPGSFPIMIACMFALILKVVDLIHHGDSLAGTPGKPDMCGNRATHME